MKNKRGVTISLTQEEYAELIKMAAEDFRAPSNMVLYLVHRVLKAWRKNPAAIPLLFDFLDQEAER